jgi:hypothetical protein
VVAPDVGGGFGPKARLYPEEIILAALALTLDHPVRWVEDRSEHLLASAHSRDHHYRVTAYADRHGKVLGLDAEIVVDAGAYGMWPRGPTSETNMAARCLPGPYTMANYRARGCTVATNKTPFGPYRGWAARVRVLRSSEPSTRSRGRSGETLSRYAPKTWSGPNRCRTSRLAACSTTAATIPPLSVCAPKNRAAAITDIDVVIAGEAFDAE